jgi:hypothetical protein
MILLLGIIACLSSLLRFGQRENEISVESDSDYYLDMAQVFWGEKASFNKDYFSHGPHHYNRPLLPFMAGGLGRFVLHNNFRSAFSILNILFAWLTAIILYKVVLEENAQGAWAWLPSLCYLTAFPQMNWGYHILTETTGIALAFAASYCLARLLTRMEAAGTQNPEWLWYKDKRFFAGASLFLVIQTAAFLARETAWLTLFVWSFVMVHQRLYRRQFLIPTLVCMDLIFIAWIPETIYAAHFGTGTAPLLFQIKELANPKYIGDFLVKSALVFHLAWIPVLLLIWKRRAPRIPAWMIGWCIGALAYMAAGYFANTVDVVGYPMRLTFSLFPVVFLLVLQYFRGNPPKRRFNSSVSLFLALSIVISITGVLLDSGDIHRIYDFKVLFNR